LGLSFAQTCVKAIADYLITAVSSDVQVLDHWPTNSDQLKVNANGRIKTISITKVGTRRRIDAVWPIDPLNMVARQNDGLWTFPVGGFIQPLQLDIWAGYDGDREDIIDQLDDALTAGIDRTIVNTIVDDPVKDGIVLALDPKNGWTGYLDCWFDEPDLIDTPQSIKQTEFRATYLGEGRGTFARVRPAPILKNATLKYAYGEQPITPPNNTPADTVTVTSGEERFGQSTLP